MRYFLCLSGLCLTVSFLVYFISTPGASARPASPAETDTQRSEKADGRHVQKTGEREKHAMQVVACVFVALLLDPIAASDINQQAHALHPRGQPMHGEEGHRPLSVHRRQAFIPQSEYAEENNRNGHTCRAPGEVASSRGSCWAKAIAPLDVPPGHTAPAGWRHASETSPNPAPGKNAAVGGGAVGCLPHYRACRHLSEQPDTTQNALIENHRAVRVYPDIWTYPLDTCPTGLDTRTCCAYTSVLSHDAEHARKQAPNGHQKTSRHVFYCLPAY